MSLNTPTHYGLIYVAMQCNLHLLSACIGTDYNYLSYLWEMTHLYAPFHANGVKQIREGKELKFCKDIDWYYGGLNSCGRLGYHFQRYDSHLDIGNVNWKSRIV